MRNVIREAKEQKRRGLKPSEFQFAPGYQRLHFAETGDTWE
jgi:hypothetical protein